MCDHESISKNKKSSFRACCKSVLHMSKRARQKQNNGGMWAIPVHLGINDWQSRPRRYEPENVRLTTSSQQICSPKARRFFLLFTPGMEVGQNRLERSLLWSSYPNFPRPAIFFREYISVKALERLPSKDNYWAFFVLIFDFKKYE